MSSPQDYETPIQQRTVSPALQGGQTNNKKDTHVYQILERTENTSEYASVTTSGTRVNGASLKTDISTMQKLSMTPPQGYTGIINNSTTAYKETKNGNVDWRVALCVIVFALLVLLAIGLGGSALAIALTSNKGNNCTCMVTEGQVTSTFSSVEDRLDHDRDAFEELSLKVTQLAENTSMLLLSVSPTEMTTSRNNSFLQCTRRIEAECTGITQPRPRPGQSRIFLTPYVREEKQGSVAVNFQCIRFESEEQTEVPSPFVAALDVNNGQVRCLFYVLEIPSHPQTESTKCALRVTRCTLGV